MDDVKVMKIVQINATYAKGSTGRIVRDIHSELKNSGHESYVFSAMRSKTSDENVKFVGNFIDHKVHALLMRIDKKQGFHSNLATRNLCKKLKKINPDIVHLHNLHSNYINLKILLSFLAQKKIAVLITLHDCWFFTGGCMYYTGYNCENWKKTCNSCPNKKNNNYSTKNLETKRSLYENLDFLAFNGVSKWTTMAGKQSILNVAKHVQTVYNWVDTSVFFPKESVNEIREKYGITEGEKIILGVSQGWNERKGIKEFKNLSKDLDNVKVLLVGEKYNNVDEGNLKFLGVKEQKELIELYSIADVFVNPSRMETFGLVTIEAMACGAPIVAYDNTGSSEIVTSECGRLVEDGNYQNMLIAVKGILTKGRQYYSEKCIKRVVEDFEKNKQVKAYLSMYEKILLAQKKQD